MAISRRELFQRFGQSTLCLAVSNFIALRGAAQTTTASETAKQEYDYRKWEDLYRKQWTWDKIAHCTHPVGCTAQCEWSVFVKDGVAFREEQIEHPRAANPENPDPGPQGCQRGASYTNVMYAPDRIKYPLKRIGKRGEGKWIRVSWDEALTEAADAMIDAIVKDQGGRSIIQLPGDQTPWCWGRFCSMLGATVMDTPPINGDQNMGYYATFGSLAHPGDVLYDKFGPPGMFGLPNNTSRFDADLIFIWHWNPIYTWIPYYKEFSQARYRGAQLVTVAPDLSPSAVHADYWIPVEPGTDVALALGMCQVIVEEKLYKPQFLKEQTDLPFLVRDDTQKFLRESDLRSGGRDDQFYVYDLKTKKVVAARRDNLDLGSVDPALEGTYQAEISGGRKIAVRPVFDRLKQTLNQSYTPELAAELISKPFAKVHPDVIREVARKAGKAKSMCITTRFNASKCYHVDLINRSIALFLVLSGHARPGGDERSFFELNAGWYEVTLPALVLSGTSVEDAVETFNKRRAVIEEIMKEDPTRTIALATLEQLTRQAQKPNRQIPGWQWLYYRAGFKDRWNNKQWHDPHYRDFAWYVQEANQKGWVAPLPGSDTQDQETPPARDRVLLSAGSNFLRKLTGSEVVYNQYLPSLEKIIAMDFRMGGSTLYADLVLPCASFYEVMTTRHNEWLIDKAVEPLGESKSEWDISTLLAKKISQRVKERGIPKIEDKVLGKTLELDKLYDQWTQNGTYKEGDGEKICEMVYRVRERLGISPTGTNLETVRKAKGIPPTKTHTSSFTRPPFGGAVERQKLPHPTLTRRMQFYLDHDWYIEAGEELPVHRPHPLLGGDYPFHHTGGHGRESIHSIWITNPMILRLTRGVPSLFINKETAERLGIADYEEVEIYNDAGLYRVRVKHSAIMRPNQVAIYHCWEKYQLSKGHWNAVNPSNGKPLLLAGGLGHLNYTQMIWQPNAARRGARVGIRKIGA